MDRNFPRIQEHHRWEFISWLIQFGNDKRGVYRAHTKLLRELNLPDTPENRNTLRGRLRNCNPNHKQCLPHFREAFESGYAAQIGKLKESQDRRRALRRDRLSDELDRIENHITENPTDAAALKHFNDLLALERTEDEYEARLHGLFPGTRLRISHDSEGDADIGDISDLPPATQVQPGESEESD